ncbi:hypothetical protein IFVP5_C1490018 [Vibrio parahaemolyticus]
MVGMCAILKALIILVSKFATG